MFHQTTPGHLSWHLIWSKFTLPPVLGSDEKDFHTHLQTCSPGSLIVMFVIWDETHRHSSFMPTAEKFGEETGLHFW